MTYDPIQSWLNAAGRFPLLPKSELIRLAKKRDTLEPGSKAYIKVVNKICEHNLRLIPGIVRQYLNKRVGYSMSDAVAADLLQQGYIGLRRAAEKYDAAKGYTFSTYANNWIRQAFTRWHNSVDRSVYIPENTMCEILYRRRNGQPSRSKNGRIGEAVLNSARRSLHVGSIDVRLGEGDDDGQLVDILCSDNRILDTKSAPEDRAALELRDLMAKCGINPRTQDIVSAYAKRGNMAIVAAKLGLAPKHCQNLYQEAVREMKATVKKEQDLKNQARAVRLKSNNTTSPRN